MKKGLKVTPVFENLSLSIFEKPAYKSLVLHHMKKAILNMGVVAECVYTKRQGELATEIAQKMVELTKEL